MSKGHTKPLSEKNSNKNLMRQISTPSQPIPNIRNLSKFSTSSVLQNNRISMPSSFGKNARSVSEKTKLSRLGTSGTVNNLTSEKLIKKR